MRALLSIVVTVGIVTGPAWADYFLAPPWRDQPGTTIQGWEFDNPTPPGQPLPPQGAYVVDHSGQIGPIFTSTHVRVFPLQGQEWIGEWQGGGPFSYGIWPLSGHIEVVVDNFIQPNLKKLIWVELTWAPMTAGAVPNITNIVPLPVAPGVELIYQEPKTPIDPTSTWMYSVYTWELDHNPPDEFFTIGGDIFVDELVVDTWCTPEPATMGLLAFGGLAMLRRRRRRA